MNIQHIFQGGIKCGGLRLSAPITSGSRLDIGTSTTDREKTSVADTKFLRFYLQNSATSGDNRGMYLRLFMTGAGGGGEAARLFTTCENVACGTAHGAHISLDFGTTGSITGLGIASRNTLHVPNAMSGGTYAATQSEIFSDSATSDLAGVTEQSFHRFANDGNATGKGKVDATGNLFSIQGLSVGSGKLFQANTAADATHALRILIGGTPYFIMLTNVGA